MPLLHISPRRLCGRFVQEPLPPPGSFDQQVVLVTGGTTGLGLAAAIHFAALGARVIITCRSISRGEAAKKKIEETTRITGKGNVTAIELDMNTYASCVAFVDKLKKSCVGQVGGLDVAVLNAGSINPQFVESPEGWEGTIQVNTLSTALLGLLLLAWMKEKRLDRKNPARLIFVSSRDHLYPDITHWPKWARQEGILRHVCSKENWPAWWATTEPNYDNSKLLLVYAINNISQQALGSNGKPQVIVNHVCPGIVRTEIGRLIANQSWYMKILVPVYLRVLGKSPDSGARFYVTAALRPIEDHGKFSNGWLSEEQYAKIAIPNVTSEAAKKVQELSWNEIIKELTAKVPALQNQAAESGK